MKRYTLTLLVCVTMLASVYTARTVTAQSFPCPDGNATLVIAAGAVGLELQVTQAGLDRFMKLCPNIKVTALQSPDLASDRLSLYNQFLGSQSPAVDVYQIDVVWPATLAEHLVDLNTYIDKTTISQYFPSNIQNNTVDGHLVALPWFIDAGLLYYRTDLLKKYNLTIPQTWDDLTADAKKVQDGERAAGNAGFWGYVWQGANAEATTVNALEWQASEGGGTIISADGKVQVNNDATIHALERAAGWIGAITPEAVLSYTPEDSRKLWQAGNAEFMRNWNYAYPLATAADSPVAGKFDVAPLPSGASGKSAATLGGWQLAVSKYSKNPKAAAALVQYLASSDEEKIRSADGSYNPTIEALYKDADVLAKNPFAGRLYDVFNSAVPRPSAVAGNQYPQLSSDYYNAVHAVLAGKKDAKTAMEDLEFDLEDLMAQIHK